MRKEIKILTFYFQKYNLNILRFTQVSLDLGYYCQGLHFTFKQAGLLMDTKKWELYEWEEELKVLGLEYFYIGKNS